MTTEGQSAQAPAPADTSTQRRQFRRIRNLALVVVAFVAGLGAVAGGALYFFYDRATAIDRSNPEGVVVQFLDAALVQQDPGRVGLLVCTGWSGEQALAAAAPPARGVSSTWNDLEARIDGARATAVVTVQFVATAPRVRLSQEWTFQLEEHDGWRVCDLSRQSLEP